MSTFQFMTKQDLTLLLARKARNATELLAELRDVPACFSSSPWSIVEI